ncbi:MAG: T9SS type A sorting domain-containing protein [Chitinophagaceae bacterium]|nr:T9SS type A sorting domain-containing protein [Chitinophagaceae bacterium]
MKQGGFIRLFDANGELFQQQAVIAQTMTIDISKLAKGIYLLQYLMDGEVMSQKIIKQ